MSPPSQVEGKVIRARKARCAACRGAGYPCPAEAPLVVTGAKAEPPHGRSHFSGMRQGGRANRIVAAVSVVFRLFLMLALFLFSCNFPPFQILWLIFPSSQPVQ